MHPGMQLSVRSSTDAGNLNMILPIVFVPPTGIQEPASLLQKFGAVRRNHEGSSVGAGGAEQLAARRR